MFLFRRVTLWLGCASLTIGFVVAEEWAGIAATLAPQPRPLTVNAAWEHDRAAAGSGVDPGPVVIIDAATARRGAAPSGSRGAGPGSRQTSPREVRRICRVTAYCDRGTTAAGIPSGVGQCAAPADIPLGSQVYIPALGRTLTVTDRTHRRFRHNTVDIFIPGQKSCRRFGRRYLTCEFSIVDRPPAYGQIRVPQHR